MTNIAELDLPELEAVLGDLGAKPYHARQIYRWLYRRGITDFDLWVANYYPAPQSVEIIKFGDLGSGR